MNNDLRRWAARVPEIDRPTYHAIADAIAEDIQAGRLRGSEKLPPLRAVAEALGINFTTAARGYAEAAQRGLIRGQPGSGSFVRGEIPAEPIRRTSPIGTIDMSMNMPPEPTDPDLIERLRGGLASLAREDDLYGLLRYQEFGGARADREAGAQWLAHRLPDVDPANLLVCPGAHGALLGLFAALARPGDVIACEALGYPGIKGIAAHLGIRLAGLPADRDGLDPEAFAGLCAANLPKALYINPTLANPTTATLSMERRTAIAEIAQRYGVPIIEDDPYGCLPARRLPPLATLAPQLTFYVAGLAKVLGAGLRIGYLVLPNVRYTARLTTTLASLAVMANPAMIRLATRWIVDGTVRAATLAIREESRARQRLAARALAGIDYWAQPEGFHLWLPVPRPWTRVELGTRLRQYGVAAVESDTFAMRSPAPEAMRICLGGRSSRDECHRQLEIIHDAIEHLPAMAAGADL
ncbi:PLP-dependent aminotransferase family protein [Salinisphaera sp. P385]|uniref:PLP-dependent aminotransferase family protein n=1 Tax=Spectribacter acetivorans TaxID=3075603 RepID=A0ABU3BAY3_9GAMM|nr:PLP-dependent aminotransferase family protein [Salinisphaera sp. P385]MDT0619631.1 PLP-dependent aminotransferase family protein [Salinisphaera sp. P385]